MKKAFAYILLTFLFIPAFGQKDIIEITGKVKDKYKANKKIHALKIWLTFNDSLAMETNCDSSGTYSFKISKSFLKSYKVNVVTFQDEKLLNKMFPPPSDCPFLAPHLEYFQDIKKFEPTSNSEIFILDIELNAISYDLRYPCIGFKKNSAEFQNCGQDNSDTTLFCLRHTLADNPTITIQLGIHSWNEKNLNELTKRRGQHILAKLNSIGVDTSRVKIKLYYNTRPLISKAILKKAPNKVDRETLEARNRRATFSILDFGAQTIKGDTDDQDE